MRPTSASSSLRLLGIAALMFGLLGCANDGPPIGAAEQAVVVCADGETLFGIDVSHWQSTIDWDAVAGDGVEYAFIRVSDGVTTYDREFDRNWPEARRVGILRGVYQFFRVNQDPIEQADLLVTAIGTLEADDLPPVLDIETLDGLPASTATSRMRAWLSYVEAATGRTPIVYTGFYFWRDSLGNPDFSGYPLWIAQYGPVCPDIPSTWDRWAFHQTSSTGRVAGIGGDVDTNLFNGGAPELLAFATGAPPSCGDGVCSPGEEGGACVEDCPICEPVPPAGRVIDERDRCFEGGGDPRYLRQVDDAGYESTLIWTHATDDPATDNYGLWSLTFEEEGDYALSVYMSAPWAESRQARYVVRYGGIEQDVVLDQSAEEGWRGLGSFHFVAGGDQWLRLDDNTGEPLSDEVQIVFDAMRLERLGAAEDAGIGGSDAGPEADAGVVNPRPGDLSSGCRCALGPGAATSGPGGGRWGGGRWLALALSLVALALREAGRRRRGSPRA